ncbi:MAG: hypothetical protein U0003_00835 [Vampirovibrionales bacterium]
MAQGSILSQPLTAWVDHTWLPEEPLLWAPEARREAVEQLVQQAVALQCAGVCVRLHDLPLVIDAAPAGASFARAVVVGFPAQKVVLAAEQQQPTVGTQPLEQKMEDIQRACRAGATELDVVWNTAEFREGLNTGDYHSTRNELNAIMQTVKAMNPWVGVKLIIETDVWTEEECFKALPVAAELCAQAGVAMVKTCTGYVLGGRGATQGIIRTIRQALDVAHYSQVGIKASGGIRTREQAEALLAAGATRLGMSQTQVLCDPK